MKDTDAVVTAIHDLARITIALNGGFNSRAEVIRRLSELAIPPSRIAAILAMETKDVTSTISRARKKLTKD